MEKRDVHLKNLCISLSTSNRKTAGATLLEGRREARREGGSEGGREGRRQS